MQIPPRRENRALSARTEVKWRCKVCRGLSWCQGFWPVFGEWLDKRMEMSPEHHPQGMGPWMVPSHSPWMETGVAALGPSAEILAKMQIHGIDP